MDGRRAGRSTRDLAAKRRKASIQILSLGLVVSLFLLVLILKKEAVGLTAGGVTLLTVAIVIIARYAQAESKKIDKMERRAVRGAKAEERVGSILDDLGEDFLVLHDVPCPYGNIDHVVISKQSGVYLIETKAHGGRVSTVKGQLLVNGRDPEKNFITQTLRNTYWLRDEIQRIAGTRAWIIPVIVFTNAFVEPGPPIKNVLVINRKYLLTVLQRPITKAQAPAIWDRRNLIQASLHEPYEATTRR